MSFRIDSGYISSEDTSFVVGDSPATIDVNAAIGRNGSDGYIKNDGAGNFIVTLSSDGSTFGNNITVTNGETLDLEGISIDSIKITHVTDSSYRVFVK